MIRIGLTGTIGAGKSTVGALFESWGARRIDADELARQAVEPGTRAIAAIKETFGSGVILPDGSLDRVGLRGIVFADPEARARLEEIVHPAVDRLRAALLEDAASEGTSVFVLEIPLLFEKNRAREFDAIVAVDAPVEMRRRRVGETRGITPGEFAAMDAAQWDGERKRAAADHVVWNDGDRAKLEREARAAWDAVTGARTEYEHPPAAPPTLWRVDLHSHTSASKDCLSSPGEVVRHARDVGLDRIAITDHDEIDGALEARSLDPELVIVGEEVRTVKGLDIIGLFISEHIPRGGTFREIAEEIRRQGGVVYAPHPFDAHRGTTEAFLDDVADCIDVVEGFNARIHDPRRNQRAQNWALAKGLPVGAGSDAHTLGEIGRATVRLPAFDGPSEFLTALPDGRIEGRSSSPLVHFGSTWAKIAKRLGAGA
jgi:dephospho-CoA kinase